MSIISIDCISLVFCGGIEADPWLGSDWVLWVLRANWNPGRYGKKGAYISGYLTCFIAVHSSAATGSVVSYPLTWLMLSSKLMPFGVVWYIPWLAYIRWFSIRSCKYDFTDPKFVLDLYTIRSFVDTVSAYFQDFIDDLLSASSHSFLRIVFSCAIYHNLNSFLFSKVACGRIFHWYTWCKFAKRWARHMTFDRLSQIFDPKWLS